MSKSILLIEDDRFIATLLQASVGPDFEIDVAEFGEDGLGRLQMRQYDLILLDYILPEMDGLAVLREVRSMNKLTPVLFMTGHGSLNTAMEALKLGATDYISKPFDPEIMRLRILQILGLIQGDGPAQRNDSSISSVS